METDEEILCGHPITGERWSGVDGDRIFCLTCQQVRKIMPPQPPAKIDAPQEILDAVDDLWGCIGKPEIDHLQPATVEIAQRVHEQLWNHS